jgi:hypothetical protein
MNAVMPGLIKKDAMWNDMLHLYVVTSHNMNRHKNYKASYNESQQDALFLKLIS